ncbi:hypothetical protein [Streptomyces globisporus]|uniref:hypothetical protein n=1 Tax=Streptomyces globisporus TaxID=1908 RepID=UPI0004C5DD3F|nr:hypothetical protein [Streptomyces globisporus]
MHSTPEPELPDPVPATRDAVTPDLPAPGPDAPDVRGTGGERSRTAEAGEDGERRKDPGEQSEHRPAAGPGTPAPQEQTD